MINNRYHTSLLMLFGAFVFANSIYAQDTLKLNLSDLLSLSDKENYAVRFEENKLEIAQANKQQAYYSLLPAVNIYGSTNSTTGLNFDQVSGTLQTERGKFATSYINLSLDFTNLLFAKSKIDQANQQFNVQYYKSAFTKEMTALYVVGKYIEVLQAYRQRTLLEQFYNTQQLMLNRTNEMVDLGSLSEQDKRIQQADLQKIAAQMLENEMVINSKLNELRWMLKLDINRPLVLQEDGIQEIEKIYASHDEGPGGSLKECYALALAERNDLKGSQMNVQSQKRNVNLQRASFLPKIYFFYNYGSGYSSFQVNDFNTQFSRDNIKSSLGLQFEVPLFNGLSKRAAYVNARENYENVTLSLEQSSNQVLSDVSNTKAKIALDIRNGEVLKNLSDARKQIYDVELEKHQLGTADLLSVSIAYRDYLQAMLEYSKFEYQLLYDKYLLSYHLGYSRENHDSN